MTNSHPSVTLIARCSVYMPTSGRSQQFWAMDEWSPGAAILLGATVPWRGWGLDIKRLQSGLKSRRILGCLVDEWFDLLIDVICWLIAWLIDYLRGQDVQDELRDVREIAAVDLAFAAIKNAAAVWFWQVFSFKTCLIRCKPCITLCTYYHFNFDARLLL